MTIRAETSGIWAVVADEQHPKRVEAVEQAIDDQRLVVRCSEIARPDRDPTLPDSRFASRRPQAA